MIRLFKIKFTALLICAALVSPPLPAAAQRSSKSAADERIRRIENGLLAEYVVRGRPAAAMNLLERMKHYKVPGLSIAVIDDYRIAWAKGYGLMDAEKTRPVTTGTLFQAGSISKPVTAVGAMKLVETGRLALDENVNDRLVSWKVPENEFTKDRKVTVRGLLTHSAGITVRGFDGYAPYALRPTLAQILDGEKPANSAPLRVAAVPGKRNDYSGGGFTILQQLMIDVAKTDFPQLMNRIVLAPLGMKRSFFGVSLPAKFRDAAAAGHRPDGAAVAGKWHAYPELAAAGLWTTPSDLARFVIEIQKSRNGASNRILAAKSVDEMLTPQFPEVGLGFGLKGAPRPFRFGHNGSTEGFYCLMLGYFENGRGAVVMTNSDNGAELVMEIMRAVAKEYGWNDLRPTEILGALDQKIIDSYVGAYDSGSGFRLFVTTENGKLYANPPGGSRQELIPETETTFLIRMGGNPRVEFVRDAAGKAREIVFRRGGGENRLKKVE
ncbi:MAG: serine hydrolase [Acidobacteria bacterium]|nr:serine hydrolase [Acidobacteriota bacterium]